MLELHKIRKLSEMVVRGWYMPHFNRRDLLNSKKTGLGWVPQLVRPPRADLRNFSIFSEISVWAADREKPIFLTFESEKKFQK